MKSGKFSILRSFFLFALTGFFMYSASVQDIHYMFVKHEVELNDHCDHHLHAQSNHVECSLCKIELSSYAQTFDQFELPKQVFFSNNETYHLADVVISSQFAAIS